MAKIKTEPTLIDRIREVHPRYSALLERQSELLDRQAAAQAEAAPLGQEERRALLGWVTQQPKPKPRPIVRHAGAVDLVGELLSPQPIEEISPPPPPPTWAGEQRSRELGAELEAIAEALKLLAPEITKARKEYSKLVAAQRAAEYQKIVESIVDAARKLGDAAMAAHEFVDAARIDGVDRGHLRPLLLGELGDLAEQYSPLRSIIERAIELKHVGAGRRPDWRLPASPALIYSGV
ncbi:hypothetical protein ABIA00_006111 [Bradyrhizobium ottawaense]|uniref:hypothetical protein n=1 Tax=Bradyrhizobium ottawaense TaxID=931866 RepID=UPI00383503F6